MKRIISLVAVFACLAFVVNSFAGDAKKDGKKPAAGKDDGKKDGDKKDGEKKDEVFYVAKGKAYHSTKDCLKTSKPADIKTCTKAEAEKMKLTPCKKCSGEKKDTKKGSKKGGDKKDGEKKGDKK